MQMNAAYQIWCDRLFLPLAPVASKNPRHCIDDNSSSVGWLSATDPGLSGNGTDAYGFRALPVGVYSASFQLFGKLGTAGCFWCNTNSGGTAGWTYCLYPDHSNVVGDSRDKVDGLSVRCIAD